MRRILQREHEVFGKREYEQLAKISVSHLYNLRRSKAYRKVRVKVEPTRASKVSIAERRKPQPLGRPGYRLILYWNQTSPSGSRCIGNEPLLQAHLVLDNSVPASKRVG